MSAKSSGIGRAHQGTSSGGFAPAPGDSALPALGPAQAERRPAGGGGGPSGGSGVAGAWHAVAPTGKMLALPAAGAYELATTEFSGVKGDYTPNIPLIPASNSDAGNNAASGQVDAGTTVIAAADTAFPPSQLRPPSMLSPPPTMTTTTMVTPLSLLLPLPSPLLQLKGT